MLYCGISLNVHGAAMSGGLLLTKKQVDETVRNKVKLEEDLQRSNIALIPPTITTTNRQFYCCNTSQGRSPPFV